MPKETVVIDLGGSILTPKLGQINLKLLEFFRKIIKQESRKKRFIIVTGGGSLARSYQKSACELKVKDSSSLDWIGIRATQLNAEFLKSFFGNKAFPQLIVSQEQKYVWNKGIILSGGWQPGNSTDYVTLKLAEIHKAKKIVIASNIEYIYDSDPKKNPKAKKFESVSWHKFNKLFNEKWEPGMTVPLDPKAAKLGQKIQIPLFFVNGNDLNNFKKAIQGNKFTGTIIS